MPAGLEAIPTEPVFQGAGLASLGSLYAGPPVPSPLGSPPWSTKPSTRRWNVRQS